jgi:ATP-dependent exoDNAse (exonuclease V) beta subunit
MSWVFAGDTAQMISPGCSFKFAGLKQTLLSIQPGIESKLKKVDHLLVNYRTTKHILDVGNAILSIAKEYFPGAIEFARKERAVHDFGLPVVTCDWDEAMATLPSFGKDQALVYSFSKKEEQSSIIALQNWLGRHPFILSVLDSKGLEFDDVVIAFDLERAAWKVEDTGETVALSMLREMYVAVTRAKRRVVILVKHRSDTMSKFLSELKCGLVHHSNSAELINEFNTSTSEEQ